jgi:outer membrane lipoprotein-sorting protein
MRAILFNRRRHLDDRRGRFLRRGPLLALVALGLCSPAFAWDLEQLMTLLAAQREGHATFVETTYLKMLERPLESSGELMFAAPDRLEKRTLLPKREVLSLSGDQLSMERKGRTRVVRLSDYPQIGLFVDSIRGTLMGDRTALEHAYELALSGDEQGWRLELTPKAGAARIVSRIVISGSGARVENVEIAQADGDRSVMRIVDRNVPAAPAPVPAAVTP